jgi:hypothetical protein
MNVEIGTETPIFLLWEYLFRNFSILSLQCSLFKNFIQYSGGKLYMNNKYTLYRVVIANARLYVCTICI